MKRYSYVHEQLQGISSSHPAELPCSTEDPAFDPAAHLQLEAPTTVKFLDGFTDVALRGLGL